MFDSRILALLCVIALLAIVATDAAKCLDDLGSLFCRYVLRASCVVRGLRVSHRSGLELVTRANRIVFGLHFIPV
ncbi:hypothetical protein Y032_0017g3284 [Ancylostoma ceylanicum]|uniref:Secreted protein n=1 Tax=Ancylostoma ceylanicum TaxID=53326 RepID=A0A016V5M6_9BILA|nr:hypothetical protein Y032_0017g3284 [Ancylostoma ceylanicum]